jgi:hypothetical protein
VLFGNCASEGSLDIPVWGEIWVCAAPSAASVTIDSDEVGACPVKLMSPKALRPPSAW